MAKINDRLKISVIIPVYNSEKYLVKCIKSVLTQNYKNLEIILIDDGSTDNSLNIIKKYAKKDCRIKYYVQKNQGGNIALNNGLKFATGDYIHFVDSDDYIKKDSYSILISKMSSYPKSDLCLFGYYQVFPNNKIKSSKFYSKKIRETSLKKEPYSLITRGSAQWSGFYKSSLIKKNNIKFDDTYFGYDVLFRLNVLKYSNSVLILDLPLVFYRIGDIKSSSGKLTRSKDYKIHFECFNHCIRIFENEEKKINDINVCHQFNICLAYLRLSLPNYLVKNFMLFRDFLLSLNKNTIISLKSNKNVYQNYLSIINYSFINNYIINLNNTISLIENSKSYNIGRLITSPYRILKNFFIKLKSNNN